MIHCDSNQRCEFCPVERLSNAEDRVKAGNTVRSVVRILSDGNIDTVKLSTLRVVAEEISAHMHSGELTGHVIGAAAINLAGECKVD